MNKTLTQNTFSSSAVLSIYHDRNNVDAHLTGFVVESDSDWVLIAHISSHGLYDGYILLPTEQVHRIDQDGEYEHRISRLYHIKAQCHNYLKEIPAGSNLRHAALHLAKTNNLIVSIIDDDSVLSGYVRQFDSDTVSLCIVNETGQEFGTSVIENNQAQIICVDTDDEQDMRLLHQHLMKECE